MRSKARCLWLCVTVHALPACVNLSQALPLAMSSLPISGDMPTGCNPRYAKYGITNHLMDRAAVAISCWARVGELRTMLQSPTSVAQAVFKSGRCVFSDALPPWSPGGDLYPRYLVESNPNPCPSDLALITSIATQTTTSATIY